MNRRDCNNRFGAANIAKVETFKIDGAGADFGDFHHMNGAPVGDAVICWLRNGSVAVLGHLFSDNLVDPQTATVEIFFRKTNGSWSGAFRRSHATNGITTAFFNWKWVNVMATGSSYDRVRIKLKVTFPDAPGGPVTNTVANQLFDR